MTLSDKVKRRPCGRQPRQLAGLAWAVYFATSSVALAQAPSAADAAEGGSPPPATSPQDIELAELRALREELARQQAVSDAQAASLAALKAEADNKSSLEAQTAAELAQTEERLRLYGFLDFGLQKSWFPTSSGLNTVIESTSSTFVLGNLNLYLDARPTERWRALTDLRYRTGSRPFPARRDRRPRPKLPRPELETRTGRRRTST